MESSWDIFFYCLKEVFCEADSTDRPLLLWSSILIPMCLFTLLYAHMCARAHTHTKCISCNWTSGISLYAICEKMVMFFLGCVVNCQQSRHSSRTSSTVVRIVYILQFCKSYKLVASPVKSWSQPLIILTLWFLNWVSLMVIQSLLGSFG